VVEKSVEYYLVFLDYYYDETGSSVLTAAQLSQKNTENPCRAKVWELPWLSLAIFFSKYSLLFDYLGLAESVVQVNTVWNFRTKKVVRVQEKQV
jgi:hypothetical protein